MGGKIRIKDPDARWYKQAENHIQAEKNAYRGARKQLEEEEHSGITIPPLPEWWSPDVIVYPPPDERVCCTKNVLNALKCWKWTKCSRSKQDKLDVLLGRRLVENEQSYSRLKFASMNTPRYTAIPLPGVKDAPRTPDRSERCAQKWSRTAQCLKHFPS